MSRSFSSLGTPLFDRVGKHLHLNASGLVFYEYAKQAMQILDNALIDAVRSAFELPRSIYIDDWSFALIPLPCISEYMTLHPMVNVQILQNNHYQNHHTDRDYDFILTYAQDAVESNQSAQNWVAQPFSLMPNSYFIRVRRHTVST